MTELERALVALGRDVDFPPTPDLASRVAVRLEPRRRDRRRVLVLALAVVALAVGIAFAVPPARSAILRFLGFGPVRIELVDTLPRAQERPLSAGLGPRASEREAREALTGRLVLPAGAAHAQLHLAPGPIVSAVLRTAHGDVLLSELAGDDGLLLKKAAAGATTIEGVSVNGRPGLWLTGAAHVFMFPQAPPRLAGNVLLWQTGGLTLRLEGPLTRAQALAIARTAG